MKKIVTAASVLAVTGAIAMPAPATAEDVSGPQVAVVACPNGLYQCVEDLIDYVGDESGHALYRACRIVFGPDCSIPQP